MSPPGIRFNDYFFTEPVRLADWTAPKFAGLFVILAPDLNWAPKTYQPLYFGEFGNNTPEVLLPADRLAENRKIFFISVLPMPFSTTTQRWAVRNELLWAYNTAWQNKEARAAASGLAGKLADMEKKPYQEQVAQVLLLLAGVNKLFEAQAPLEPRRRIGFLP